MKRSEPVWLICERSGIVVESTKRRVSVGSDVVRPARAKRSKATAGFTSCGGAGSGEGMDGCKAGCGRLRGANEEGLARVADRSGFAREARKMAVECCEGRHTGTSAIC